jgi:hypothetical protein
VRVDYQTQSGVDTSSYTAPLDSLPTWMVFNPTGIYTQMLIQDATLDDLPLTIGDWIGVFDEDGCAGMVQFIGDYPLTIPLIMEFTLPNGSVLPGATLGNPLQFRLWHCSMEYDTYYANYALGNNIFGNPLTVVSLLQFMSALPFDIIIRPDYVEAISFPGLPYSSTYIEDIMNGLNYPDSLILVQDDSGRTYIPSMGVNTINSVNISRGYQSVINGLVDDTLSYEYQVVDPQNYPIYLYPSYVNMVGYPLFVPLRVDECWGTVVDSILVAWNDDGVALIPSFGVTDLDTLLPGEGYYIFTSATSTLSIVYPSVSPWDYGRPLLAQSSPNTDEASHFNYQATGKAYFCLVNMESLIALGFGMGDVIGVFDGELCVGEATLSNLNREWLSVSAWEQDELLSLPGFTSNHPISLKSWNHLNNTNYNLSISFAEPNQSLFRGDNFSVITVEEATLAVTNETSIRPDKFELKSCYPNPFNVSTIIRFQVPSACEIDIEIFNILGERVKSWHKAYSSAGNYQIQWDGTSYSNSALSSGIYFCVMNAKGFRTYQKVFLVK